MPGNVVERENDGTDAEAHSSQCIDKYSETKRQ